MAHFYGTVQGARGEATRCGTKSSGMRTTCAGWGTGIISYASQQEGRERDLLTATFTGGSRSSDSFGSVDYWREPGGTPVFEPDVSVLLHTTDTAFLRALRHPEHGRELTQRLRKLVFANMDQLS